MTQMGDEMILDLAAKLESSLNKIAAKKDEKPKSDEDEGADESDKDKDDDEGEKDGDDDNKFPNLKPKSKKKKKKSTMQMIHTLSKLATELDDMGVEEASNLVDDALRVIVKNIGTES